MQREKSKIAFPADDRLQVGTESAKFGVKNDTAVHQGIKCSNEISRKTLSIKSKALISLCYKKTITENLRRVSCIF